MELGELRAQRDALGRRRHEVAGDRRRLVVAAVEEAPAGRRVLAVETESDIRQMGKEKREEGFRHGREPTLINKKVKGS